MRVLIACESSGTVRDAFRARGAEAFSCDLLPDVNGSPFHIQADVREVLADGWAAMISHPPCTYVNGAGLHWIKRGRIERDGRPRAVHRMEALEFVALLMNAPIRHKAIENPVGCIPSFIRRDASGRFYVLPEPDKGGALKAAQSIQPYEFGEDASKRTCLWLHNLPPLKATKRFPGRIVEWPPGSGKMVERWSNQTDSGQNRLGPSEDRWRVRSVTYPGIADAFAAQWLPFIRSNPQPSLFEV